ncbi:MAG: hypothetical protein V6Z82_05080 [Flavobacteriales bacterium]
MNIVNVKDYDVTGAPQAPFRDLEEILIDILESHDLNVKSLEVETIHGLKLSLVNLGKGKYGKRTVDEWEGHFYSDSNNNATTLWAWVNA